MKIKLRNIDANLIESIEQLQVDYNFEITDTAEIELSSEQAADCKGIAISYDAKQCHIVYRDKNHFFRALGLFIENVQKGKESFKIEESAQFSTIGPMFDLSRNAVMTVDGFKEMLRKLAIMGFDSTMLYMEDTYEIKNEPYFGYMRGRYSYDELKELDDYAHDYGIELIPCIQTLAHLEEFLKWSAALPYKDTKGSLLLESEDTLNLIENMIESVSSPFRTKKIHIGMDEAEELGRGHYLNKHGYKPRFEMMADHLKLVLEITDRLDLEAMMWSDMFLKLASSASGDIYDKTTEIPDHIYDETPDNVQLMYWRYNETDVSHYENIINQHKGFKKKPAFAGGIWIWNTFATQYNISLKASEAALTACKAEGVEDVYVTLWGDDGFENNVLTALLGLQYYAEHAYAEELDEAKLRERVKFCTGIDEAAYLLLSDLDTPPGVAEDNEKQTNPSKFMLWQDVLLGLFDKHIEGLDMKSYYEALEQKIHAVRDDRNELDYIFDVPEKLTRVLALKATLGVELKAAYDNQDEVLLSKIANAIIPEVIERVRALRKAHRHQWLKTLKPFGWEVIDIRYGGLLTRLDTATERINDYLNKQIDSIEELEQERLYFGPEMEDSTGLGWNSFYTRMATPNAFHHVMQIF